MKKNRIGDKNRKQMLKILNFQDPAQIKSFNYVTDFINDFYQGINSTTKEKIDPNQMTIHDKITC